MKDYKVLKQQAISLRTSGLSYGEIKKKISVSKSTLSLWLKAVPLAEEHKSRLYTKQIGFLSHGSQSQRERRLKQVRVIIELAKSEINTPISNDILRLLGACLYWAEGSKKGLFSFSNSDPAMILFIVQWIEKMFDIRPIMLKAWLNIYAQQDEKMIISFWSDVTGIPVNNFGKCFVKPTNKGYKKQNLYYGTIKIVVPKSVDIKYQTLGWIQGLLQTAGVNIQVAEDKWSKIREVSRPVNI